MSDSNIILAQFKGEREIYTDAVWQWNVGQVLQVSGITLPAACEAHVSNNGKDNAETILFSGNQLRIYDSYFANGRPVYVWIYLTETVTDPLTGETMTAGTTEYMIVIPIKRRSKPAEYTPSEDQHDAIAQAIAAMNATVTAVAQDKIDTGAAKDAAVEAQQNAETAEGLAEEHAQAASESEEAADRSRIVAEAAAVEAGHARDGAVEAKDEAVLAAESAQESAQVAENTLADAQEVQQAIKAAISIHPIIINGKWFVWSALRGEYVDTGVKAQGEQGDTGNGISRVSMNQDYTITLHFTDGSTFTTDSLRGQKGDPGETYTLTMADREAIARIAEEHFTTDVQRMRNDVVNAHREILSQPKAYFAECGETSHTAGESVTVDGNSYDVYRLVVENPGLQRDNDMLYILMTNNIVMPDTGAQDGNRICLMMQLGNSQTGAVVDGIINNLYTLEYPAGTLMFKKNRVYAFRVSQFSGYYFDALDFEADLNEAKDSSADSALTAESYGAGTKNGVPVTSGDPAHENNAPYFAGLARKYTDGKGLDGTVDPAFNENNAQYLLGLTRQAKKDAEDTVNGAKQAIDDEGAEQVQAVENKGAEVLESIPADYQAIVDAIGAAPTEESAAALLTILALQTMSVSNALDVAGDLIEHLPQDEPIQRMAVLLRMGNERLETIYEGIA